MPDPRTLAYLRKISADVKSLRAEQQASFAGLDVELQEHSDRLDAHDDRHDAHEKGHADHERRLKRLERLANGR